GDMQLRELELALPLGDQASEQAVRARPVHGGLEARARIVERVNQPLGLLDVERALLQEGAAYHARADPGALEASSTAVEGQAGDRACGVVSTQIPACGGPPRLVVFEF